METATQTCYRHPDRIAGIVCQRCDRPICPSCMHQASVGFHCPECTKAGAQKVYRGPAAFQVVPVLTQVLIGINVALFVLGVVFDGGDAVSRSSAELRLDYGLIAKFAYLVDGQVVTGGVGDGEWYRIVTSGFLHAGLMHLLFNMYALWVLGRAIESGFGRLRFGAIYGVSLLAGSFGALLLSPDSLTVGASGAIYGLMGALFIAHRAQGIPFSQSPLLWVLGINLVITVGVPGISIGGHVGGLLGGLLAAWILVDLPRAKQLDKRLPVALCGAAGLVLAIASVVVATGYQG